MDAAEASMSVVVGGCSEDVGNGECCLETQWWCLVVSMLTCLIWSLSAAIGRQMFKAVVAEHAESRPE